MTIQSLIAQAQALSANIAAALNTEAAAKRPVGELGLARSCAGETLRYLNMTAVTLPTLGAAAAPAAAIPTASTASTASTKSA